MTRVRLGRRRPVWPVVAGAVLAASALRIAPVGRAASGMVLLASFVVVVALGVLRRIPRLTSVRGRSLYAAHLVSGAVAGIALLAHAQSASSFAGVVGATIASGALAALAYAAVPRRLARSSHGPVLLEEAESQLARTEERAFSLLSGRSDPAKALYAAVVRPYVRAPFGGVLTILAGRSPEAEARRLRARARALVGDRTHVLEHLDELLDVAVAARGCKAAIVATRLLRSVVLVHVVIAAIAVVLASMHVARVLGGSS